MRNSYNAVDDLDFVAMDEFQKSFFLYRQSEWEDYRDRHPNVMQGDLADPVYFDFISFAQYAVINQEIKLGRYDFVEKFDANGTTQIVRRDSSIMNDMLPSYHERIVGERLLA